MCTDLVIAAYLSVNIHVHSFNVMYTFKYILSYTYDVCV